MSGDPAGDPQLSVQTSPVSRGGSRRIAIVVAGLLIFVALAGLKPWATSPIGAVRAPSAEPAPLSPPASPASGASRVDVAGAGDSSSLPPATSPGAEPTTRLTAVFAPARPVQTTEVVVVKNALVVAVDSGTGRQRTLAGCPGGTCTVGGSIAVSPDGSGLAFVALIAGYDHVITVDLPSGKAVGLVSCDDVAACLLGDIQIAWSPDGARLAYTMGETIWTIETDGSARTRLFGGFDPAWSADGSLTFTSLDGGGRYTYYPPGADIRFLGPSPGFLPTWSPDGAGVAYIRDPRRTGSVTGDPFVLQLWVANTNGSKPHKVYELPGCCLGAWFGRAAWSPDGQRLAWVIYNGNGGDDLVVVNADGTHGRRLLDHVAAIPPAWGAAH